MSLRPEKVLRIGIPWQDLYAMGAGKAALLEAIRDTGSISAAGRQMGLSYRKAWMMVDAMNRAFRAPLVETVKGGMAGGGAVVTEAGLEALGRYQALRELGWRAIEAEVRRFAELLRS
jgi:molybdate transport system regulatory protein